MRLIHAWWFGYTAAVLLVGSVTTLASLVAYDVWCLTRADD